MILKYCKQRFLLGIILLSHVQGRVLLVEEAPLSNQPNIDQNDELDKNQYSSEVRALDNSSIVAKSQVDNAKQNKRIRRKLSTTRRRCYSLTTKALQKSPFL